MTLLPGAEPFFHRGNTIGILGLHGFTASPAEMRWLGEYLAARGFTVYVPRLAGHGTDPRDLARSTWRDWYASALDGYTLLAAQCERVFVVGHSMGGLLALLLAMEKPLCGAAVLAAPIDFRGTAAARARWLKWILPYTDQTDKSDFPAHLRQEQARRGEPERGRVRYNRWSTAAVAELVALADHTRAHLSSVSLPLLLLYSQADPTAPPAHAETIARGVRSPSMERHTLNDCGHILPQDIERETVFERVTAFVERLTNTQLSGAHS